MNGLMRHTIGPGFGRLRRELDSLFEDLAVSDQEEGRSVLWMPRTDVSETENAYVIRMDMPGLKRDDVNIELQNGRLTVSGERKIEHQDKGENVQRIERTYGRFFRSFMLPDASDADNVKARLDNGVLTIEVPKRETAKPRRIQIGDGASREQTD